MTARLRSLRAWGPPAALGVAVWILHEEIGPTSHRAVLAAVQAVTASQLATATCLVALAYVALGTAEWLSVVQAGASLSLPQVAFTSFVANSFTNTTGDALLTRTPVRFKLYSALGLSGEAIASIVAFGTATSWMGFCGLFGGILALAPHRLPPGLALPSTPARAIGLILLTAALAPMLFTLRRQPPILDRGFESSVPAGRAAARLGLSSVDWLLGGATLWCLVPSAFEVPPAVLFGAYLMARALGAASRVPGGLGVFETVFVLALQPTLPASEALAALLLYRLCYHLGPFGVSVAALAGIELRRRQARFDQAFGAVGSLATMFVPQAIALSTFVGGSILLLTGATPARASRLAWLNQLLPLPIIEASHLLASVAGTLLLVLARGLQRRVALAYRATLVLLGGGILFSLLRGLDWPTAVALGIMLATLAPLSASFDRPAALSDARLAPGWLAAIALVVLGMVWLVLFSFRHVHYSDQLWWTFALRGDAPRSLRGLVVVAVLLVVVGLLRLVRPAGPDPGTPGPEELDRAEAVALASSRASSLIALLGDKRLLFSPKGDAFLMYGVSGRSWVALGDPVTDETETGRELAWRLRDLAEHHGGWPVFYQVSDETLPRYVDMGLTLLKIGEVGQVPLESFSLAGGSRKEMRQVVRRTEEREGGRFELLTREQVPAVLPRLREISDAWLADKKTGEKGFSLGRFEPGYLTRFPIAVVHRSDEIVAFCNVLAVGPRKELSLDLMRYTAEAPPGVMTYLFVRLMVWGAEQGFERFSLGMAPLAGLEERTGVPLWNRVAGLVYRHGEHFYNFQGLRAYKDKFEPAWHPRYLACPGGLALPQVVANLTTLISGGVSELFRR